MKTVPDLPGHVEALGPYSHCVVANGFVFVAAQTPISPGASPGEWAAKEAGGQTKRCLGNIETILKELGLGLDSVVKTTVFLRDPKDFKTMNEAYKEFFSSDPPARSTATLGVHAPGLLVAIDAVAVYEPRGEG